MAEHYIKKLSIYKVKNIDNNHRAKAMGVQIGDEVIAKESSGAAWCQWKNKQVCFCPHELELVRKRFCDMTNKEKFYFIHQQEGEQLDAVQQCAEAVLGKLNAHEEWVVDTHYVTHKTGVSVWIANEEYGIHINLERGKGRVDLDKFYKAKLRKAVDAMIANKSLAALQQAG